MWRNLLVNTRHFDRRLHPTAAATAPPAATWKYGSPSAAVLTSQSFCQELHALLAVVAAQQRLESSWFSFTVMSFYFTSIHTHTKSGGGFVSASPQRSSLSLNPPAVTCDPGQLDSGLCCFHNRSLSSVRKHPDP